MPTLCKYEECTGCQACIQVCKHQALHPVQDEHGFIHPYFDGRVCIECGLCEIICPILNSVQVKNKVEPRTLAAWHEDMEIRWKSSSGGAFSALSDYVLKQQGVVFGAAAMAKCKIKHISITQRTELDTLRRSKYVQSDIGKSYIEAKKFLQNGRLVLFSGTPCQIAGLYAFLRNHQYDNLYTVDFICHGVPSPLVFEEYIKRMETKYGSDIVDINFRDKRNGVEANLLIVFNTLKSGVKIERFKDNSFYHGFISSVFLRDSCYQCQYATMPRYADITLADYRNIGNKKKFEHEKERPLGFTGVMVNNEHGEGLIQNSEIQYEERYFAELASSQPHLKVPVSKPSCSDDFFECLKNEGYDKAAQRFLPMSIKKRIEIGARMLLGVKFFYALGKLVRILTGKRPLFIE